ncbi:hypothetical protein HKBW3S03_00455 [Candidatus Hakubella thermalkaliphila]|uniref:Radical SAM core domain-containing protein n=2 Tax=Candidatus Hakubella thermalkaliphila TaxID=2754717 RepID=A0A6V8Q725_9ACTN|nr:radical SAM protein [Candidatus Hakubella thermalkaliphila]GFP18951.1 hypothetical protein HKBW3S03_00455 [Candidatus Hakubella thermalkaliphila]GFP29951.1 hypothetical protein HKBW3S34_00871 [Candidatus Hakubella thermalkaliphila]GFP38701.1 hypothetical protein HKBW3S47_00402 [Candidatus Hakubella thermalkaliphila]
MDFTLNVRVPGEITRLKSFFYSFIRHNTWKKFRNLCLIEAQMRLKKEWVRGYPYILKIDPSNACNLHCPMCPTGKRLGQRRFGEMRFETFKKVIDELGEYCYRILLYGQGEPFIARDLIKMIKYASDRNIGVSISSNLNLLDEKTIDKLIESGLEHLIVSLDGTSQESYQQYRVGGNFEKVIDTIRMITTAREKMGKNYPIIEWQYLVMRHNENEIEEAKEIAGKLGVDVIRFSPFSFIEPITKEDLERWVPRKEQYSYYRTDGHEKQILNTSSSCSWLYRTAVINWDGGVSPCCSFHMTGYPENDFGNIQKESFKDIWNNELYRNSRRLVAGRIQGQEGDGQGQEIKSPCDACDMIVFRKKEKIR